VAKLNLEKNQMYLIRTLDCVFALLGILFFFPLLVVIYLVVLIDVGQPLLVQIRLGKGKIEFKIFKFRTMKKNTRIVGTHLIDSAALTRSGIILRSWKLDELPQLFNVLLGDMSLVGPRPCLTSQMDVIKWREHYGVFAVRPGITGLAQLSGIDMSKPKLLAIADSDMIKSSSVFAYFKFIILTVIGKGLGDQIKRI
jgi:lipopolysaccharide/colanic/teichoic acid biosynthesis glycosyltransferase